ncbi:uncharacterized protein DDB_G0287625-like isoform X2 [Sitodiplosis mosellana]|nr:uncharacterized protein DDB_G0287625-like isoform X2 [Sitodiplosis mosellana]
MEKKNKRIIEPMEDEEDLELLRLAALKSLKKENVPAAKPVNNVVVVNHIIPVVSNIRPTVDKFYTPCESDRIQPNLIHHPVPPYVNSGFEKMEISESYLPRRLNPQPHPFNEYVPFGAAPIAPIFDPITNVQLSPRSAAFVNENKQIIKRRQGISPSHSPVSFRKSPGRWSRSPSPDGWKYRRSSKSRSPAYPNHSPHFRNRSVSRSPQRRRNSPQSVHSRRNRTRSPNARTNFDGNAHRSERRTPPPNRRANSPATNRHPSRTWPAPSTQRDNGTHLRKSGSPRADERRRRTRSPLNATKSDVRRRTLSRSPNRKYPRTNTNRPPRRTPPGKRFNNSNNSTKPGHGGARNRNHNRRSGSPSTLLQHRRSHSPANHHKCRSPARNHVKNGPSSNKSNEKESQLERNDQPMEDVSKNNEIDSNEEMTNEKTKHEMEDELLASSDSENSDDDNNNDGIDLFASEESESENEGRFKLSSSKSERKLNVPVVSFSELGKTTTAPADVLLRDLDELQADANQAQRRGGARRDNDRHNRNRRDDRRFRRDDRDNKERENRDRERGERGERDRDRRDRDRGRVDREREHESSKPKSSGSWKNSKNEDSRKKDEPTNDTNGKGDRKLFKQTFTTVDDKEPKSRSPDAEKSTDVRGKGNGEKRNAVQLKRSSKSTEKIAEAKSLQSTVIEKRASPPSDSVSTAASAAAAAASKKPIHLRLGAMTKTWKTSKKTWRTEKV